MERSQKRKGLGDPVEANVIRNKPGINQGSWGLNHQTCFFGLCDHWDTGGFAESTEMEVAVAFSVGRMLLGKCEHQELRPQV